MKLRTSVMLIGCIILWRVLLNIPLSIGEKVLPYNKDAGYTNIWGYTEKYESITSVLIYPWANFDGVHYLSIAAKGYENNGRFFPLYPGSIYTLASAFQAKAPFDHTYFFTALFLSYGFFLPALYFLYKLILFDYNKNIAVQTILFLLLFPTSFFFVSIYTEGLFLLLSVLSFYFIRKKRYYTAGIFVFLLSLTRFVGILLFPILLYLFLKEKNLLKTVKTSTFSTISTFTTLLSILPLLLIPSGLLGFAYYCFLKWDNALYFLTAHTEIGNNRSFGFVLFPQTIFRYGKILMTLSPQQLEWSIALLELSAFLFSVILLFVGYKKGIQKCYLLFALLCLLVPASSGTFSGLPRYILPLFPIFLTLALIKTRWIKISYAVVGSILLFLCLMFFSKGYFIA